MTDEADVLDAEYTADDTQVDPGETVATEAKTLFGLTLVQWGAVGVLMGVGLVVSVFVLKSPSPAPQTHGFNPPAGGIQHDAIAHASPPTGPAATPAWQQSLNSRFTNPGPGATPNSSAVATGQEESTSHTAIQSVPLATAPPASTLPPGAATQVTALAAAPQVTVSPLSTTNAVAAQMSIEGLPQAHSVHATYAIQTIQAQLAALQTRFGKETSRFHSLNVRIQRSETLSAAEQARMNALETDVRRLNAQVVVLERLVHSNARATHTVAAEVNQRPVLPGWSIAAMTSQAAVLYGPNNVIHLVSPGEVFLGVKILRLNPSANEIMTNAGVIHGVRGTR